MNRTKIEWATHTWNPVTGCWGPGGSQETPNRCSYCYAHKMAKRFYGGVPAGDNFSPLLIESKLGEPSRVKKPARIFVCSMGDLFGEWVPWEWIELVLQQVRSNPQHTFMFLTKNPKRYQEFNPWPRNAWVGTTVEDQAACLERVPHLYKAVPAVRFISFEPLLGVINTGFAGGYPLLGVITGFAGGYIDWFIIGAMTGPGAVKPAPVWVYYLISQALERRVPVFLKNNLEPIVGEKLVRSYREIPG